MILGRPEGITARFCRFVPAAACAALFLSVPGAAWAGGTIKLSKVRSASTSDRKAPTPLLRIKPIYPPEAQYKGYQGTVTVCFTVTAQGTVTDLRRTSVRDLAAPASTQAPPSATERAAEARTLLGDAAVATLRDWRFQPEKKDGKAVATPGVCQDIRFIVSRQAAAKEVLATQKAAAAGSATAQLMLSNYYDNGLGVEKDPVKAFEWAYKSAAQGNAYAEALLGTHYMQGNGTWPSDPEAAQWIRKSAEQGNSFGEWLLGLLYAHGRGVPQDWAQAAHWYRKSAKQGNPQAAAFLGRLYEYGRGVPKDCELAFYWYTKGAREGGMYARKALETFGMKGEACYSPPT